MPALLDQVVQVAATRILHDHHDVFLIFEHLVQPDDVRVSNLLQDVDLLEYLLPAVLVLQLPQLDHLDRDELTGQLMDCQVDFSEGALADLINELVEVQVRWRERVKLAHVRPDVADDLVPVLTDLLIQLQQLVLVDVRRLLVDGSDSRPARVAPLVGRLPLRPAGVPIRLQIRVLRCLAARLYLYMLVSRLQQFLHPVLLLMTAAALLLDLCRQVLEAIRILRRLQLLRLANDHLVVAWLSLLGRVVIDRRIDVQITDFRVNLQVDRRRRVSPVRVDIFAEL